MRPGGTVGNGSASYSDGAVACSNRWGPISASYTWSPPPAARRPGAGAEVPGQRFDLGPLYRRPRRGGVVHRHGRVRYRMRSPDGREHGDHPPRWGRSPRNQLEQRTRGRVARPLQGPRKKLWRLRPGTARRGSRSRHRFTPSGAVVTSTSGANSRRPVCQPGRNGGAPADRIAAGCSGTKQNRARPDTPP